MRCRHFILCASLLAALFATTAARAQSTAPQTSPDAGTSNAEDRVRRAPLLREGGKLVDVQAELVRDPARESWRIRIQANSQTGTMHELTLLPNTRLAEMRQMVESAGANVAAFRITGDIFVFHERNYLLVTHAPRIVNLAADESTQSPVLQPDEQTPAGDESAAPTEHADDDSVEAIMQGLRRSVGSVPRGTRGDDGETPVDMPIASPLDEGLMLVNRRGRVRRDEHGAWVFVFDADAEGLADPPVILLPCLMLETIEQRTREQGMHLPLILTGRMSVYHRQRFLLPTMMLTPRDRTVLTP